MTLFIGLLRGIDKRAARSGMTQVALGPEYGLVGQRSGLNQLIGGVRLREPAIQSQPACQ
jgi:hypothetical protein